MLKPDVTIIITCGPGLGLYLPDALDSARRQTTRCEIVVVFDRCRPPLDRVRLDDVLTYRCEFGNVQQARRAGLTCAHGQAVLFLDADNRLPPGFCDQAFRQLQRVSRADPRIAGIYPAIEYFDPQWKPHARGKLSPPVWTREQFERHPGFQDACTLVWRHALEVSWTETVGHDCLEDQDRKSVV